MDETVFGDHIDDAVLFGDLHGYREIVDSLGWEKYFGSLLGEYWVRGIVINFNYMKL
jgi:hypothetical protein